jgi:hypothetical protein
MILYIIYKFPKTILFKNNDYIIYYNFKTKNMYRSFNLTTAISYVNV